jgi:hypothetical protein
MFIVASASADIRLSGSWDRLGRLAGLPELVPNRDKFKPYSEAVICSAHDR